MSSPDLCYAVLRDDTGAEVNMVVDGQLHRVTVNKKQILNMLEVFVVALRLDVHRKDESDVRPGCCGAIHRVGGPHPDAEAFPLPRPRKVSGTGGVGVP
jgi:hypothetical protein